MAAHQQPAPQQPTDVDPVGKVKILVPRLKESLVNLMKIAAVGFHRGAQVDDGTVKSSDSPQQRFDKNLEEFYAICDQIELNLKLALECNNQNTESAKNTPVPVHVSMGKMEPSPQGPQETFSYHQYLSTVKTQITCAKEIHDALMECSRKMAEKTM